MLYTPNNILYKYIRYRFRRIQIQYNMLYDIAPKILIPIGIVYFLLFGIIFAWLVGTSEELNPLMQWELRVIDYVIPILNTIDIKWYAYPLDLLWVAIILAPIAIINASPYIIVSYIVDTILIRLEVKALIKTYSINE